MNAHVLAIVPTWLVCGSIMVVVNAVVLMHKIRVGLPGTGDASLKSLSWSCSPEVLVGDSLGGATDVVIVPAVLPMA